MVRTADGDVSLEYWSDEMPAGGWAGAARLCRGGLCLEYRRQDDGPQSLFLIRRAGCDLGRRVLVTSLSVASRDHLLATFGVIPPGGGRTDAMALAELTDRRPLPAARSGPPPALACTD